MSRRLLAILCRSEGMRRSRAVLQMLLWDSTTADPAASLRQLLLQTRKRLGDFGSCLQTGADSVWLEGVTDETDGANGPEAEFFEDAGFGTEEFEDWLRLERQAFQTQRAERKSRKPPALRDPRLVVGLTTPGEVLLDGRQTVVAEWVTNLVRDALGWSDFICCTDLRLRAEPPECDLLVCVHVLPVGGSLEISVALDDAGRCLWSRSVQVPNDKDLADHRDAILEFAQITVGRIEGLLPVLAGRNEAPAKQEPKLFHVVDRLFTMRPADVRWAAETLDGFSDHENLASILAWQGFSKMLMNGERLVADRAAARSEAMHLIRNALNVDPMNTTALTVASHYQAFIKRDLAYARDLSDEALAIAPFSPFARDVRATLELYDNNLEAAVPHARIAMRLGRSGPLRHYLAATGVMIDTLSGAHGRAISVGRRLLCERPRFLPVMRHMVASLAASGEMDEAQTLARSIKRIDPEFGTEAMTAERYPLPSELSRTFISTTLRRHDLWG
ncbi:hypothetical protein [Poseidonocella sedimentorum]|nr:hypothetical protein [Poseidonocella sedimentorum]